MNFINSLISEQQAEEEWEKWENKLNNEDIKMYIKKGGSHLNQDQPFSFTEFTFNEGI